MSKKKAFRILRWLGQVIVTLLLLYIAIRKVDRQMLAAHLSYFPAYYYLVIPLLLMLDIVINSWRIKSLYSYYGVKTKLWDVFFVKLHGLFFSLAFPLLGDAYKVQSFKTLYKASYAKNTFVVLLDRLIYTFGLSLLLFPLWWGGVIQVPALFKWSLLVLLSLELLLIVAVNNTRLFDTIKRIVRKLGYRGKLMETEAPCRSGYTGMIAINTVGAISRHSLMAIVYLVICHALAGHLNFQIWGFLAGVFSIMISRVIPVSVGGIGLREYVAVMVFPQVGISEELAFSTAFLMSAILIIQGLFGGLSFLAWRFWELRGRQRNDVGDSDET